MKKHKLLALALLAALFLGGIFGSRLLAPDASDGEKAVTLTVEHLSGETNTFSFTTSAPYLRAALEEQQLASGEEREYGLWVTTVDGEAAACGVESQTVTDGDHYVFTLHEGW